MRWAGHLKVDRMVQDRSSKEIYLGGMFSAGLHIHNFKNEIPCPTQRAKALVTTLTKFERESTRIVCWNFATIRNNYLETCELL